MKLSAIVQKMSASLLTLAAVVVIGRWTGWYELLDRSSANALLLAAIAGSVLSMFQAARERKRQRAGQAPV
jgi:hypothetical protein